MNIKLLLRKLVVPVGLASATALTMVAPAFAGEACWSDFNLEDCAPEGGTLVIDVTQDVTNDIDSAVGGGYWAGDDYGRHLRVWDFPDEDPLAIVQYDGPFVSIAGPSPNNTGLVGAGVTGSMTGGYIAWFDAEYLEEPNWPTEGYVGSFDYEGDPATGEVHPVSWLAQYFEDWWDWAYIWWGFRYTPACPANGYWVNSADGNEGDITGEADFGCLPAPAPASTPLVMMYVFYSPTGYFGGEGPEATNTLTIWSAQGEPAPERVAYWAGVATPADLPADSHLECFAMLMDNGAGGTFACDHFLKSVGERRALLRGDPEGRDILEPILRYLSWAAPE